MSNPISSGRDRSEGKKAASGKKVAKKGKPVKKAASGKKVAKKAKPVKKAASGKKDRTYPIPSGRDRSEGWQHAKNSGHLNEKHLAQLLTDDEKFGREIGRRVFGKDVGLPVEVSGGGANAEHVTDIFGSRTNGKPDIYVRWNKSEPVNFSIKKSTSGQVFLTSVDRFLRGYEHHFEDSVPERVATMMRLFIGANPSECDLVMRGKNYLGPKMRGGDELQEKHQHRLLGVTLDRYFPGDWKATLNWLDGRSSQITDFAFARGYAKNKSDFATHVWYFVTDGKGGPIDQIFPISEIIRHSTNTTNRVSIGPNNGGSTIVFPFGFLQMHSPQVDNQIQFHHKYAKLSDLTGR